MHIVPRTQLCSFFLPPLSLPLSLSFILDGERMAIRRIASEYDVPRLPHVPSAEKCTRGECIFDSRELACSLIKKGGEGRRERI